MAAPNLNELRPSPNYENAYAIFRLDAVDETTHTEPRVTVKRAVFDETLACEELRRLNALNSEKGCF
jgi:hypothetical protein